MRPLKYNVWYMKICVVTDRRRELTLKLPPCDLALFGFGLLGTVNYESELSGKSEKFEVMTRLSRACHCGVLSGCVTDSRGLKRKSVSVSHEGKLLGITDMRFVLDGEEYKSGATIGVYGVGGYRVGVLVENDLYFPDGIKSLSLCGCNVICAFLEELVDGMPPLIARTYAYLYGVPFVLCAGGCAYFADINGVMASSNQSVAVFETSPKNCYRVITSRRRGLFADGYADF